jgi:hypothetical protein
MMLKIDVFAPIPMARDKIAAKVKPGPLPNIRTAYVTSFTSAFMAAGSFLVRDFLGIAF